MPTQCGEAHGSLEIPEFNRVVRFRPEQALRSDIDGKGAHGLGLSRRQRLDLPGRKIQDEKTGALVDFAGYVLNRMPGRAGIAHRLAEHRVTSTRVHADEPNIVDGFTREIPVEILLTSRQHPATSGGRDQVIKQSAGAVSLDKSTAWHIPHVHESIAA